MSTATAPYPVPGMGCDVAAGRRTFNRCWLRHIAPRASPGTYMTRSMKAYLGATIRWRWPGAAGAVLLATLAAVPSQGDEFASDAARLAKAFKLSTGQTVADIGAGGGQLTVLLARAVGPTGRVYATELDTSRVRSIREAAA